jgi:FkbM family methyltransferase
MKRTLRKLVDAALESRGYVLKEKDAPLRGFKGCLAYAKQRGLAPKTVFDIGVGRGTPWLYDAFPNSKLVLCEPLSVFDADVTAIAQRHNAAVHKVALGDEAGTAEFNVNIEHPTSSSMLRLDTNFAHFAAKVQAEHRFATETVAVDTLDNINNYPPPYVLKLDVEGSERTVLEGASQTLRRTEYLLMEISVMRRLANEPSFAEMLSFLDECGFELFDIPSLSQTSHGTAQLIYLDAAFVPKGSRLWPS